MDRLTIHNCHWLSSTSPRPRVFTIECKGSRWGETGISVGRRGRGRGCRPYSLLSRNCVLARAWGNIPRLLHRSSVLGLCHRCTRQVPQPRQARKGGGGGRLRRWNQALGSCGLTVLQSQVPISPPSLELRGQPDTLEALALRRVPSARVGSDGPCRAPNQGRWARGASTSRASQLGSPAPELGRGGMQRNKLLSNSLA
ncbi:hypothetical protein GQ53DRAFT_517060 [Thozetella sp. PMI_491]|nr:hypothetical protein GQ53DRAFT_517060 [Thozetella sp. PMI_491]